MKTPNKPNILNKSSEIYSDVYPLRALVQAIPILGGPLDTILTGPGSNWRQKRLEDFLNDLHQRLEQVEQKSVLEPSEEMADFIFNVFESVVRTKSETKRSYFASVVENQVRFSHKWEEAERITRILENLTQYHVAVLSVCVNKPPIKSGPLAGMQAFGISPRELSDPVPDFTFIKDDFPNLSSKELYSICSELISYGLLKDDSIGRIGVGAMGVIETTPHGREFIDWITAHKG
jgi:hypothetical protein